LAQRRQRHPRTARRGARQHQFGEKNLHLGPARDHRCTELKDTLADSFAVAHGYTDAADMASSVKQMYSMPFTAFA